MFKHLSDFWQLFLSFSLCVFLTFSHSLSDHVIHARLHVWTRTTGIQSKWTLAETSVKLQQNGKTRAAVWPRLLLLLWCEFKTSDCVEWTCGLVTKVEDPLSTNLLWHLITYLTQGTTWPVKVFEGWVHMLHPLPATASPSLSFLSCSLYVTLTCLHIVNEIDQLLT